MCPHCVCSVYTWGQGAYGTIGKGDKTDQTKPYEVKGPLAGKKVVDIKSGAYHVSATTSEGEVYLWGHNQRGQCLDGTKNHLEAPKKVELPQFQEYAISQVYCGYNSTHIVIGSATEGLHRHVYELGNFFASKESIAVTVPSRIRITNTDGREIRRTLAKQKMGSDAYERLENEYLEYVFKLEPRTALFSAPTPDLSKMDYSKKESVSNLNGESITHEKDAIIPANSLDRMRIEAEVNRMKSANIAIMKKLQYRALKLSCFEPSMNAVWNFDVKNGILQRILNIDPSDSQIKAIDEVMKWPPTATKQLLWRKNVIWRMFGQNVAVSPLLNVFVSTLLLVHEKKSDLHVDWKTLFEEKDEKSLMLMIELLRNTWTQFKDSFEKRKKRVCTVYRVPCTVYLVPLLCVP